MFADLMQAKRRRFALQGWPRAGSGAGIGCAMLPSPPIISSSQAAWA